MINQGCFFFFKIKLLMLRMLELQPEGVKKKWRGFGNMFLRNS